MFIYKLLLSFFIILSVMNLSINQINMISLAQEADSTAQEDLEQAVIDLVNTACPIMQDRLQDPRAAAELFGEISWDHYHRSSRHRGLDIRSIHVQPFNKYFRTFALSQRYNSSHDSLAISAISTGLNGKATIRSTRMVENFGNYKETSPFPQSLSFELPDCLIVVTLLREAFIEPEDQKILSIHISPARRTHSQSN